ncbi:phage tail tape measure protein [Ensifer adhaerens]|nr:phage tail tape measure protein [Ensifer adhaerens]
MDVSLLIRLIDQVSGPAQKVRNAVRSIGQAAGEMKRGFAQAIREGFSIDNIEASTSKAEAALSRARGRLMGAFGMALSLGAPLKALGDFEERLISFGNTAGVVGDKLKAVETKVRGLGPAVNQSAGDMLSALDILVGKGLSPEAATQALKSIGMTATAAGADINDMAGSGFAVLDNLKVPVIELQRAFDAMAQAGKSGGFELDGMAQYFPGLTASAQQLGMQGVDSVAKLSAALQIAMKGTKDQSSAANNLQNFLSKLSSPETVKNFAEMGVNVEREFKYAADNGIDVFEHMLAVIQDKTAGDPMKVNKLFGDMQVLAFLKPMLANMDEYRKIRDEALKATGVNEADYQRVMMGLNAQVKALVIEFDNLLSQGSPLLDVAKQAVGIVKNLVVGFDAFASANPELTRNIILTIAALMSLSIAGRLLAFAFAGLRLGLIPLMAFFLKFNAAGRNVALGWRLLSGSARGLAGAVHMAGAALRGLSSSAGSAGSALAATGRRASMLRKAVSGMIAGSWMWSIGFEILDDLGRTPEERIAAVKKNHEEWKELEKRVDQSSAGQGWQGVKDRANALMGLEQGVVPAEALAAWASEKAAQFQAMAGQWVDAIVAGFEGAWGKLSAWLDGQIAALKNLFSFDVTINWPEPPAWLKFLADEGSSAAGAFSEFATSISSGGTPQTVPAAGTPGAEGTDWLAPIKSLFASGGAPTPETIKQTIAAEVVDKRPPQVTMTVNAPISVTGVTDPAAAGKAAAARLGSAIASAKASAMHGGTEE